MTCTQCRCTEGYELPPLEVLYHEVPTAHANAGFERDGQGLLLQNTTLSLSHAARERKLTLDRRMQKVVELIKVTLPEQVIVWCELDEEQRTLEAALRGMGLAYSSLYGSQ